MRSHCFHPTGGHAWKKKIIETYTHMPTSSLQWLCEFDMISWAFKSVGSGPNLPFLWESVIRAAQGFWLEIHSRDLNLFGWVHFLSVYTLKTLNHALVTCNIKLIKNSFHGARCRICSCDNLVSTFQRKWAWCYGCLEIYIFLMCRFCS